MTDLITVKQLDVSYFKGYERQKVPIIRQLDLTIKEHRITGIIGESGAGKSILMRAVMDILPENFVQSWETFLFAGKAVRETRISSSMIFQDPKKALDPVKTIGSQLIEVICRFQKIGKKAAKKVAAADLARVGIDQAAQRLHQYPHELSGGICQRVMIAMALATKSKLLIADEPTTALDVITQQQILQLIKQIQAATGMTVILISHDFKVIQQLCNQVCVMYFGEIIEFGTLKEITETPKHPYTKALLDLSAAVEFSDHTLKEIKGSVPATGEKISGCFFYDRCLARMPRCKNHHPPMFTVSKARQVRCFLHDPAAKGNR